MLRCLEAPAPPLNLLAEYPRIADLISLYFMSKSLGALPDTGGLLDMRADHYAFFVVFTQAEAEYIKNQ